MIPAVEFDEIKMAWEIMRGVTEGKLQTENPEQVQFQDDQGNTMKVADQPWARIMMGWVQHLPKERCPQIGSRVIALTTLIMQLPETLYWGLNHNGQVHDAFLKAAAYSPLDPAKRYFDPRTFGEDAEAERRVMSLLL